MNRKILNKLLVCALVLNVAAPAFNAAELSSEIGSETNTVENTIVTSEAESEVVTESEAESEVVTESEAESEIAEEVSTKGNSGENDFFISADSYIGDENTQINEAVDGTFTITMYSDSSFVSGATITIDAPAGVDVSNLTITNDETDEVLVEGTDYTLENNVITLANDFELGTDLTVGYTAKMLNATSDILGSTTGVYMDLNDNEEFDGNDYYVENPGFDIIVTNDGVTQTENVSFQSELVGGEISVENTGANRRYENGQISGSADYSITNTGVYAIEIRSLYSYFDLVSDSADYNVFGVYSDSTDIEFSVHGSEYMAREELIKSFDSSAAEYLNPGESIDVKVSYSIDKEMTEANLDKYNFGSWLNFTKHAKAQLTVDARYADNIFNQDITTPEEIVITTSLYEETDEITDGGDETTEDKTTEDKTSEDKADDSSTQMEVEDDGQVGGLATTGNATTATLMALMTTLVLAFIAKFNLVRK